MKPAHERVSRARLMQRFEMDVVRHDECWSWAGVKNEHSYGVMTFTTGNVFAHRVSYFLFVGPIPPAAFVLHKCHNPECSNPSHLQLGTQLDNMRMSREAGRLQRRIPIDDIKLIEQRRLAGETLASIATSYNCTPQCIGHTIRGYNLDESKSKKPDAPTMMTFRGETRPLREWAKSIGINRATLRFRYVRKGWSAERALTEPVGTNVGRRKP